jgi:hypothetical protein
MLVPRRLPGVPGPGSGGPAELEPTRTGGFKFKPQALIILALLSPAGFKWQYACRRGAATLRDALRLL